MLWREFEISDPFVVIADSETLVMGRNTSKESLNFYTFNQTSI